MTFASPTSGRVGSECQIRSTSTARPADAAPASTNADASVIRIASLHLRHPRRFSLFHERRRAFPALGTANRSGKARGSFIKEFGDRAGTGGAHINTANTSQDCISVLRRSGIPGFTQDDFTRTRRLYTSVSRCVRSEVRRNPRSSVCRGRSAGLSR